MTQSFYFENFNLFCFFQIISQNILSLVDDIKYIQNWKRSTYPFTFYASIEIKCPFEFLIGLLCIVAISSVCIPGKVKPSCVLRLFWCQLRICHCHDTCDKHYKQKIFILADWVVVYTFNDPKNSKNLCFYS